MARQLSPWANRKDDNAFHINNLSPISPVKRPRLPLSPLNNLPKFDSSRWNPHQTKAVITEKAIICFVCFGEIFEAILESEETPTDSDTDAEVKEEVGLDGDLKQQLNRCRISVLTQGQKTVGKGSFGTVLRGTWQGQTVAVKVLSKFKDANKQQKMIDSEMNAKLVAHRHIVKILEVHVEEPHCFIIMEFVPSSLQRTIEDQPKMLTPTFIYGALCHISKALAHCHEMGVLHLDVKPANILVTRNGDCKLADFGCSLTINQVKHLLLGSRKSKAKSFLIGTPGFMAPELIQNQSPSSKSDVFSFGILMWAILAKQSLPFPGLHMHTILFKVVSQSLRPCDSLVVNISKSVKEVYFSCWAQDSDSRPPMASVSRSLIDMKLNDFDTRPRKRSFSSTLKPIR